MTNSRLTSPAALCALTLALAACHLKASPEGDETSTLGALAKADAAAAAEVAGAGTPAADGTSVSGLRFRVVRHAPGDTSAIPDAPVLDDSWVTAARETPCARYFLAPPAAPSEGAAAATSTTPMVGTESSASGLRLALSRPLSFGTGRTIDAVCIPFETPADAARARTNLGLLAKGTTLVLTSSQISVVDFARDTIHDLAGAPVDRSRLGPDAASLALRALVAPRAKEVHGPATIASAPASSRVDLAATDSADGLTASSEIVGVVMPRVDALKSPARVLRLALLGHSEFDARLRVTLHLRVTADPQACAREVQESLAKSAAAGAGGPRGEVAVRVLSLDALKMKALSLALPGSRVDALSALAALPCVAKLEPEATFEAQKDALFPL